MCFGQVCIHELVAIEGVGVLPTGFVGSFFVVEDAVLELAVDAASSAGYADGVVGNTGAERRGRLVHRVGREEGKEGKELWGLRPGSGRPGVLINT